MEKAYLHPKAADVGCVGGAAYWVRAEDGLRLRVAAWDGDWAENGSVLIFPGRTDYIEQFAHSIGEFQRRGYATLAIDWRGHGLSDRVASNPRIGHVGRFSDYQMDVAAMFRAARDLGLPKPWYIVAHSMGGGIALRSLLNGVPVSGCAFTAPMWGIDLPSAVHSVALPITFIAQALGMTEKFAPGHSADIKVLKIGFEVNTMTSDQERYAYLAELARDFPDAQTGGPSMGWLRQALLELRSLAKLDSPDVPCIAFCGDPEDTIDAGAIKSRMARWPNGALVIIPGAKHELMMEALEIRSAVFEQMIGFFDSLK